MLSTKFFPFKFNFIIFLCEEMKTQDGYMACPGYTNCLWQCFDQNQFLTPTRIFLPDEIAPWHINIQNHLI